MVDLVERGAQLVSASNLGNYSLDMLPYISHDNLKSIVPTMLPSFEGFTVGSVASSVFNVWTILKILVFLAIAANFKTFPLVYHACESRPRVSQKSWLIVVAVSIVERFSICAEMSASQQSSDSISALPAHHHQF